MDDEYNSDTQQININIRKVENGFLVQLSGQRELDVPDRNGFLSRNRTFINKTFVYPTIEQALAEIAEIFIEGEKELVEKAEKTEETLKAANQKTQTDQTGRIL